LGKDAKDSKSYDKWQKDLVQYIRQKRPLTLYKSKAFKETSKVGESQSEFRARLAQLQREDRDLQTTKLRQKYADALEKLQERLRKAEYNVAKQAEQAKQQQMQTLVNVGTTLLGAFMGRKAISSSTISRASRSVMSAGRMQQEHKDVAVAQETVEGIQQQMADLEAELGQEIDKLSGTIDPSTLELDEVSIKANASDVNLDAFMLLWLPCRRDVQGVLKPDWS
jgi:hypothetical protein